KWGEGGPAPPRKKAPRPLGRASVSFGPARRGRLTPPLTMVRAKLGSRKSPRMRCAQARGRTATMVNVIGLVGRTVAEVERDLILETLRHCLGNRTRTAAVLGISIRTLRNKLNDYAAKGLAVPRPGTEPSVAA